VFPFPSTIIEPPHDYLRSIGEVFAVFDANTQDSGNVSYGVRIGHDRYFVKTAGPPDASCHLPHCGRVDLLRNAIDMACDCDHPALVPLLHVIDPSPHGPVLIYEWADGELLGGNRDDPSSAHQRFRRLPAGAIAAALDSVFDLHRALASMGWIAVDFYDASLMYDFAAGHTHVIDIDMYHRGQFTNTMGRMFGASRFMAPEEFTLGAVIDERTTVFTLGRAISVFLSDCTLERQPFRCSDALYEVMLRACRPDPGDRYATVAEFYAAWHASLRTA
jgi:serine/threonine-protein kinase